MSLSIAVPVSEVCQKRETEGGLITLKFWIKVIVSKQYDQWVVMTHLSDYDTTSVQTQSFDVTHQAARSLISPRRKTKNANTETQNNHHPRSLLQERTSTIGCFSLQYFKWVTMHAACAHPMWLPDANGNDVKSVCSCSVPLFCLDDNSFASLIIVAATTYMFFSHCFFLLLS